MSGAFIFSRPAKILSASDENFPLFSDDKTVSAASIPRNYLLLRKKCNIVLCTLFRVFLILSALLRHFLPPFANATKVCSAVQRLLLPP